MESTPNPPEPSFLAKVFLSRDEPRLKAVWRLSLHTLLLVLLGIVITFAFSPLFGRPQVADFLQKRPDLGMAISAVGAGLVVGLSVYLARRFLDRRSFGSLGLALNRQAGLDVLAGFAITCVMMGLIYLAEVALGWSHFTGFAWQTTTLPALIGGLLASLVAFLAVGFYEELVSRGYHLQNISDGLNLTWGVILSSLIFGVLHLGNPGASWAAVLGIFLAGFFLAYPFVRTRQLWLSIGLHFGWNFFEGVVFGFPVSGLDTLRLIEHTVNGPELWTGGPFGPEAGLIVIPALLIGTGLVYLYTRSRTAG